MSPQFYFFHPSCNPFTSKEFYLQVTKSKILISNNYKGWCGALIFENLHYGDKLFMKISIPLVCFAHMGIRLLKIIPMHAKTETDLFNL